MQIVYILLERKRIKKTAGIVPRQICFQFLGKTLLPLATHISRANCSYQERDAINLQIGLPWEENFSSYSVMMLP